MIQSGLMVKTSEALSMENTVLNMYDVIQLHVILVRPG
jgi:hypothetical protein